jgi:hypothetical protein
MLLFRSMTGPVFRLSQSQRTISAPLPNVTVLRWYPVQAVGNVVRAATKGQ